MRIYNRNHHRFFDELVTVLCSLASLGIELEAYRLGTAPAYGPTDYITFEGTRVTNSELRFFPHKTLTTIIQNQWPTSIEIEDHPLTSPGPAHPLWLTGIQGLHGSMIQFAFVHYFETVRVQVQKRYGNTQHWPPVWDFGRVVRNAFAHGGEVYFENPNASPVNWRTLIYSPANNGRQILYQDLTLVEVMYLLEDMDAAF